MPGSGETGQHQTLHGTDRLRGDDIDDGRCRGSLPRRPIDGPELPRDDQGMDVGDDGLEVRIGVGALRDELAQRARAPRQNLHELARMRVVERKHAERRVVLVAHKFGGLFEREGESMHHHVVVGGRKALAAADENVTAKARVEQHVLGKLAAHERRQPLKHRFEGLVLLECRKGLRHIRRAGQHAIDRGKIRRDFGHVKRFGEIVQIIRYERVLGDMLKL